MFTLTGVVVFQPSRRSNDSTLQTDSRRILWLLNWPWSVFMGISECPLLTCSCLATTSSRFSGLNQVSPVSSVTCSIRHNNIRSGWRSYLGNFSRCPCFLSWLPDSYSVFCIQWLQDFSMSIVILLLYFCSAPKAFFDVVGWILRL